MQTADLTPKLRPTEYFRHHYWTWWSLVESQLTCDEASQWQARKTDKARSDEFQRPFLIGQLDLITPLNDSASRRPSRSSDDVRTGASPSLTSSVVKKRMSVKCFTQEPFRSVYGGPHAVIRHANFDP